MRMTDGFRLSGIPWRDRPNTASTMDRLLFGNPYFYTGAIVAKFLTCVGTLIWSFIVLIRAHALDYPIYSYLLAAAPEDVYGAALGVMAAWLIFRLVRWSPPHWSGVACYFVILMFWGFVFLAQVFLNESHLYPTGTAGSAVILLLSIGAAGANPKSTVKDDSTRVATSAG